MIALGTVDRGVSDAAWNEYLDLATKLTGHAVSESKLRGEGEGVYVDKSVVPGDDPMTVKDVQDFLHQAGFLPFGRRDGICGYRTTCAIRLFQEYVRTVEKDESIGSPDGVLGKKGFEAVARWQREGKKADWETSGPTPRYTQGLDLLDKIKAHCKANPSKMLQQVNAFSGKTDTLKVAEWDFDPRFIHLIGVRESSAPTAKTLNDVFFLFIRGMVFTFFGSTDPGTVAGEAGRERGAPFLVTGQHLYRFGWHKLTVADRIYQALKPHGDGVLVVRSKPDMVLSDDDIAKGVELNHSINIHWGGSGFRDSAGWSAGCQVIAGKTYLNHRNERVDMGDYAASGYGEIGFDNATKTFRNKGAYTVLGDIVASFSGSDNDVHYTLLTEEELQVSPGVVEMIKAAKELF